MDGLESKIKLDKKTIMMLAGGGLLVMIGIFVYFVTAFKPEVPQTESQKIVTKNESKTYSKYVALSEDRPSTPSATTVPTELPSPTPEASPTTAAEVEDLTLTPSPTEIILAVETTTATEEAALTSEPTQIAALPTTGMIEGGLLIFLVSISMIAFAFVL